jgi:hypothetical protein
MLYTVTGYEYFRELHSFRKTTPMDAYSYRSIRVHRGGLHLCSMLERVMNRYRRAMLEGFKAGARG